MKKFHVLFMKDPCGNQPKQWGICDKKNLHSCKKEGWTEHKINSEVILPERICDYISDYEKRMGI